MRKIVMIMLAACSIVLMSNIGSVMGEPAGFFKSAQSYSEDLKFSSWQDDQTAQPQPVNLYLNGGDGGELRAEMPEGNASTEVPCTGSPVPRAFGLLVGIWTSTELKSSITLGATISCSIWAKSDQGAEGVHFNCQILINGEQILDIWTNSQSLSAEPKEFAGEESYAGETIQLQPGGTIAARIYYFSNSRFFVGPGADAMMLVGSYSCDTHIKVTTNPISLHVNEPIIGDTYVTFSATYTDAFACNKLIAHIRVLGPTDLETISKPTFGKGGNGSMVSWDWDCKTDNAQDGEYTIMISLSYSQENEFGAMGTYHIIFPKGRASQGIGWLMLVFIALIVIIFIVVAVKIFISKSSIKITA